METCCALSPVGGRHLSLFIQSEVFHVLCVTSCRCFLLRCNILVFSHIHVFSMSAPSKQRAFSCLYVLSALLLSVSGDKVFESRSMIHELQAALADLAGEGRSYMGRLAEEQTVLSVQKAFSQVLGVVAGGLAGGLNVLLQYVSDFLQAAEVQVSVPINKVTPEGVIFVAQWVLMALIGYWLLSLAVRIVASTLRRVVWLLKVSAALAVFVLILSDHTVDTQTMATRLAVLVFVCVLLGVGTTRNANTADKTAHLEEQVKILEKRLKEMERRRRTEE